MYSTLAERMLLVIEVSGLKQTQFAEKVGVTPNYISMLTNGKKDKISNSLALLIEHLYGYSSKWVQSGEEPMRTAENYRTIIRKKIENLDADQLNTIRIFGNK